MLSSICPLWVDDDDDDDYDDGEFVIDFFNEFGAVQEYIGISRVKHVRLLILVAVTM